MSEQYASPPLVEASCRFRFRSALAWDWTIAGRFYESLENAYPKRVQTSADEDDFEEEGGRPEDALRLRFLRDDERGYLSLGPDLLTVGRLEPYEGWEAFRAMISAALASYQRVAAPKELQSVTLRYLNYIELPRRRFGIEEYVNIEPAIPASGVAGEDALLIRRWRQQIELALPDTNAVLQVESALLPPSAEVPPFFALELECFPLQIRELALENVLNWLHDAHESIERMFEACVTAQARQGFEKENHDPVTTA